MKCIVSTSILMPVFLAASISATPQPPQFEPPVRLKADGKYIKTEPPGYAAPAWHDVDGDGKNDLVVGQFADGKMKVYRNLGDGKLAKGEWLEAEGAVAEVPGVW